MLKKTITQLSILTIVISCIFLANGLILAWTSPGSNPPDGNVDAPLNIGSDSQYKLGALGVEGIFRGYSNAIFDGNVISAEPTISSHLTTKKYVDERITTQFECTSGAVSKINLLTGAVECRYVLTCVDNYGDSCGGGVCLNTGIVGCEGNCIGEAYMPSGTSCGIGKVCDGSGSCVNIWSPWICGGQYCTGSPIKIVQGEWQTQCDAVGAGCVQVGDWVNYTCYTTTGYASGNIYCVSIRR